MAEQAQPTQLRQGRRDQLTQATARATGRARSDLQSSFVATSARIQTDLDQASALRRRQQVIAGGAATALIIVFLLLASFVNRQILAPVIALRARMDAFDGRHHDSPPHPTQRRDLVELAALGDAFDTMARQVIDGRSALHHQAHTDELTGLPNRRAFFAHLTELRSKGGGYTVAYIDLDGFKDISDRHGHSIGDHVLESVAARLTQHSRPDDFAARLGGDEFALLLPGADADTAARAVARIMTAVLHPLDSDAGVLDVKASVGTGHHRSGRTPPNDIDQAVRTADAAMYEAKKRGRGRVSAPAGSNERHAHVRKPGRALPT